MSDKSQVGIYIGVTEHGNVETENEIFELKGYDYDTKFWSHHHNPRTVANNPAGRNLPEHGDYGSPLYDRRRLRGRQRRTHSGLADAQAWARVDVALAGRGLREHSHLWDLRQLQESRGLGHPR